MMLHFPRRLASIAAAVCALSVLPAALAAQASPDSPAAVLMYPRLQVDGARGVDTVVQLTNTARNRPVRLLCFYLTADRSCSPTSFRVVLTRDQPLSWRAGDGLATFPLGDRPGPGGDSNQGSLIPPVPSDPFEGSLLCMVFDSVTRQVLPVDALIGTATIERLDGPDFDAASYNAIGFRSLRDAPFTPGAIVLGGTQGGFEPCAATLTAVHYFDGALDAPTKRSEVTTRLVIVPCTIDLSRPAATELSLQYEVTNEFEQRLAVRREQVGCEQPGSLSTIDASSPQRSIFSAAVAGTLSGQTRVYANGGTVGLVAVGLETHTALDDPESTHLTAFNAVTLGQRGGSDVVTLPGLVPYLRCRGDCDDDRRVTVDEVQRCVSITLGEVGAGSCSACDGDGDRSVSIDELIGAIGSALNGCP